MASNDQFAATLSLIFVILYWLLIAIISIRVLSNRKATSYVAAWLLIIYVVPIVGIAAYFLFGELNVGRHRAKRMQQIWRNLQPTILRLQQIPHIFNYHVSPIAQPIFDLCQYRQGIAGINGNQLKLYSDSKQCIEQIITDIKNAHYSIDITFYIWDEKGIVAEVNQALFDAAQRGVKCRIILDSFGSRKFLDSEQYKYLSQGGIIIVHALQVSLIRMLFRRLDMRQHRKLIIVDQAICYIGSMNMVDPTYFKSDANVGEWIDIMLRINGPISAMMEIIYTSDWEIETGENISLSFNHHSLQAPKEEDHTLQVIASGPGLLNDIILQGLITAIYSAKKSLVLITPYFVPNNELLHAICSTAQRGVDVTIITPFKTDSVMVSWASRAFFTELLEANVKIYEFKGGLLHSKFVVVDQQLSLVGSVNLDMRSFYLNYELTTIIDDHSLAEQLMALYHDYQRHSILLTDAHWKNRPWHHRLAERFFYFLSPLL